MPTTVTQRGFRIHAWGGAPAFEEFERPGPIAGEVLVQVEACGVGRTVLNGLRGDLANDDRLLPRVPGHELVGRVIASGGIEGAALVGRRVVAYFYLVCGSCSSCIAGHEPLCERMGGWVGVHADGGYAPRAVLPAINTIPIPDDIDPVAATVIPDALATPVHVCLDRAKVGPADRVVVVGAGGGVGAHMCQMAMLCGADVVGVDTSAPKLEFMEGLGIRGVLVDGDINRLDPELFGSGRATVVIDLVGSAESVTWSAGALSPGGRAVLLTTFRDVRSVLDPRSLVLSETAVIGSKYASRAEVAFAAGLVQTGRIRPVIGRQVGADGLLDLHDQLSHGDLLGRGALVW